MRTLVICLLATAGTGLSQENPVSDFQRFVWGGMKNVLMRSAEKMPEEHYDFKPADTVRSFGQVLGHMADAQYLFCSAVLGEKNPAMAKTGQAKSSKAEVTAALKDALAYCDKAYAGATDASGAQPVKLFGRETPKTGVLGVNLLHLSGHYGNLVTYMRMKGVVPPTSEPGFQPVPKK